MAVAQPLASRSEVSEPWLTPWRRMRSERGSAAAFCWEAITARPRAHVRPGKSVPREGPGSCHTQQLLLQQHPVVKRDSF